MPEFAKGLRLDVTDRDEYDAYVRENANDPAVNMESWGDNSVPEALFIVRMKGHNDEHPYYLCLNQHVNGIVSTEAIDAGFLEGAIEDGVLDNTETYDVEIVEENT